MLERNICAREVSSFAIFRSANRPFIAPNSAVRSNHARSSEINPLSNVSLPDRSPNYRLRVQMPRSILKSVTNVSNARGATGFPKCKARTSSRKCDVFVTLLSMTTRAGMLFSRNGYEEYTRRRQKIGMRNAGHCSIWLRFRKFTRSVFRKGSE